MSRPSKDLAPAGMTPLARVLWACAAKERKDAVIAKMIQFAIALPAEEMNVIGEGIEAYVDVYEHEGYEYRHVQIVADGNTVASITWHGHFTDPAYSEHEYKSGAWEAVVLADEAAREKADA
jgi:hypothetical protein